jgi:7,8-dihydroneopterin aldolase/epimerase/oxygenase
MDKILLEDIELHAYHGHLPEEQKIGSRFRLNLEIELDLEKAGHSDQLRDTFDYCKAYKIVVDEMEISSSLLEHVAERIARKLLIASDRIKLIKIKISKMNPPVGGPVKAVAVELIRTRIQ